MEPGAHSATDEHAEADDHEDMEGEEADLSAGESNEEGAHPSAPEPRPAEPKDHSEAPAAGAPADVAHRAGDRGPLSFFSSWIRREPEPTPPPGRGRGGSSDPER
jgi:hypothetical protein